MRLEPARLLNYIVVMPLIDGNVVSSVNVEDDARISSFWLSPSLTVISSASYAVWMTLNVVRDSSCRTRLVPESPTGQCS